MRLKGLEQSDITAVLTRIKAHYAPTVTRPLHECEHCGSNVTDRDMRVIGDALVCSACAEGSEP